MRDEERAARRRELAPRYWEPFLPKPPLRWQESGGDLVPVRLRPLPSPPGGAYAPSHRTARQPDPGSESPARQIAAALVMMTCAGLPFEAVRFSLKTQNFLTLEAAMLPAGIAAVQFCRQPSSRGSDPA